MKSIIYIFLLTISALYIQGCMYTENTSTEFGYTDEEYEEEPASADTIVYICKGPMSKCYHKSINCRGLKSCSQDIDTISVAQADSLGKSPCGSCIHSKE